MSLVLGIMSGTSIDAVDYALCHLSQSSITLRKHWQAPFPTKLRRRLRDAARNQSSTYEIGQLHHDLGRFYAHEAGRSHGAQLVGLHGQTVFHDGRRRATLQLGEPAWLARALGVPVVSNFRAADIAVGGQGAPLATIFHKILFAERGRHICVNNLGGISNVTSLDWRRGANPNISAFDTGPANMLIDLAMALLANRSCDRHGAWAERGQPDERLLARWLNHPFFKRKPPKSTGREAFGETFLRDLIARSSGLERYDLIATLTEFTARSIGLNYSLHLPCKPERVILCGGGVLNRALVKAIRRNVPGEVVTCDALGWPPQAVEPAAFALLAWLRLRDRPGNIPETTGASRPVLLGQVTSP